VIVVDASVAVDVLLRVPGGEPAEARLFSSSEALAAPELLDVEVAQVLRRLASGGRIGARRAMEALEDLTALPIDRFPHTPLLPRIWELRDNLTAYDAAYVALAESLEGVLVTRDQRLARGVGDDSRVEVI